MALMLFSLKCLPTGHKQVNKRVVNRVGTQALKYLRMCFTIWSKDAVQVDSTAGCCVAWKVLATRSGIVATTRRCNWIQLATTETTHVYLPLPDFLLASWIWKRIFLRTSPFWKRFLDPRRIARLRLHCWWTFNLSTNCHIRTVHATVLVMQKKNQSIH